ERHALGRIPAGQLDDVVLAQIHAALRTPEMVQAVWDAVRVSGAKPDESEVVLTLLRNLGAVWQPLYPAEQQRIAQLLIKKVVISAESVSIVWCDAGWMELAAELRELEEESA
ncbi:recombinase family protein, partial [Verminephrobacter eiseniae]|nr:recombinase family protein [Verminephrobacter eiseniae]